MSLSYNDWILESKESTKYSTYETWSFRFKNYSKFKLVVNYRDRTLGDEELITLLKSNDILTGYYTPLAKTIKSEYEKTNRAQTDNFFRAYGKDNKRL